MRSAKLNIVASALLLVLVPAMQPVFAQETPDRSGPNVMTTPRGEAPRQERPQQDERPGQHADRSAPNVIGPVTAGRDTTQAAGERGRYEAGAVPHCRTCTAI